MSNEPLVDANTELEPSWAAGPRSSWLDSLLLSIVAGVAALTTLFKIGGADVWWHLRTGRWIWENGAVPRVDVFSHTHAGQPLAYTEALAQLVFYGVYEAGGAVGLVWFKVGIVGVLCALVVRLARGRAGAASLALALCIMAAHFRLVERPEVLSFVGFALTLLLVRAADERVSVRPLVWLLPVLVVWGNLHRGGTIALCVLVAALAAWALEGQRRRHLLPRATVLTVLASGALMLNPGGMRYLTSAFENIGNRALREHISEWAPTTWDFLVEQELAAVILAGAWAVGWLLRRRRVDFDTLLVAGVAVMAWHSIRFIPYAAIAMVPGVVDDLSAALERVGRPARSRSLGPLLDVLLAVVAVGALARFYVERYTPAERGAGVQDGVVPVDAGAWLKAHRPPGRMWNAFNLGGYLLFELAPETPVFIDGRTGTLYDQGFTEETVRAAYEPAVLREQLISHDIGFAVLDWVALDDPRYEGIYGDPTWELVYWDDRAAVMVRRTEESADYLKANGYRELRVNTAATRVQAWQSDPNAEALAHEVLRNVQQAPRSIRAHFMAAMVFRNAGQKEAYESERRIIEDLARQRSLDLSLP